MRTKVYVTIEGVQGAGKTRIMRAISQALVDHGAFVTAMDCDPMSVKTALPFKGEGHLKDIRVDIKTVNLGVGEGI